MQVLPRGAPRRALMNLQSSLKASFVCPSCQHSQSRPRSGSSSQSHSKRHFSATVSRRHDSIPGSAYAFSPPPPPPSSGFARLRTRRLISIAGVDAPHFLQGIITSSMNHLTNATPPRLDGFYSAFLNAPGRVLYDVFVYRDTLGIAAGADGGTGDDAFIIEVDEAQLGALMKHIKRFKLRGKFKFRALEEGECATWQVWDGDNAARGANNDAGNHSSLDKTTNLVLPDSRAPGMGHRVLSKSVGNLQVDLEQTPAVAYQIRRYLLGVAEGQDEIRPERALPIEANMDLMGGIDFRKGCYVGQELTIRTRHRGVVRKRILPCVLYGAGGQEKDEPVPQSLEYRPDVVEDWDWAVRGDKIPSGLSIGRDANKGRSVGTWLGGVGNVGLALCRLQVMTDIELPGEAATAPFDPSDEFAMKVGGGEGEEGGEGHVVKVKPFVPEWLRRGLSEGNGGSSTH